jgi:glutathione S-transferase
MITLYQLHWSHFVEKVRWALDYKRLEWRAVEVEPFSKRQMQHLPYKTTLDSGGTLHTVPTIHDDTTGTVLGESSDILAYLERQYPSPALYPESQLERDDVLRWLPWLDTEVGLPARRLAYTQVALEHPGYLAELFVPHIAGPGGASGFKARVAGKIIGGVLTQRFRFHRIREDRVYEQLEQSLLFVARKLGTQQYLVGKRFTAADLTLAALVRPTTVVPFFRNHPDLRNLYAWRESLLREQGRELQIGYESALHAVRQRRGWMLGRVGWLAEPATSTAMNAIPVVSRARNDQRAVAKWPLITGCSGTAA